MQVEVIGSRGKNWPIVDGKEQIEILGTAPKITVDAGPVSPASHRGRTTDGTDFPARNPSPNKKHVKDPHSSLDLFTSKRNDEDGRTSAPNLVSPRQSAKPAPRDMSELFAAGRDDFETSGENGDSPEKTAKSDMVASKGAGSHKFQPSRLFEEEPEIRTTATAGYKSDPAKYNHFDIGDVMEDDPMQHRTSLQGNNVSHVPMRTKANKHTTQWEFQDSVTPEKVGQKIRSQDVRHFSLDNEDVAASDTPGNLAAGAKPRQDLAPHFELQDSGTPISRPPVHKPRPDAEAHFEFRDAGTPAARRVVGPRQGGGRDKGMGLYQNNLYDEDGDDSMVKAPLGAITNNVSRKNNDQRHWMMADSSPANARTTENKPLADNKKQGARTMDSQWDSYDQSPEPAQKPATTKHLRKGTESHWSMGGENEKVMTPNGGNQEKSFWDF